MKYKTRCEASKGYAVFALLIGAVAIGCIVFNFIENDDKALLILYVTIAVLGIGYFIRCWTDEYIRNKFYKYGKRYEGRIIEAEWLFNGRGEDTYFLIISFHDGTQRRLRKTAGYEGNPNHKLKSIRCSVYEWKGKYMEGDFQTLEESGADTLKILITKYKHFRVKGKKYV